MKISVIKIHYHHYYLYYLFLIINLFIHLLCSSLNFGQESNHLQASLPSIENLQLVQNIDPLKMEDSLYHFLTRFGRPKFKTPLNQNVLAYNLNGESNITLVPYPNFLSFFNNISSSAYLTIHRVKLNLKHKLMSYSRPNRFRKEIRLPEVDQVHHCDYQNEMGFSRGHLVPMGDFMDQIDKKQTFNTANIAFQVQNSFNDGVWNQLEDCTREYCREGKLLTILTGVIFKIPENSTSIAQINGIAIPSHFYKILVNENRDQISIIPFMMENRKYSQSESHLEKFVTKIDRLEFLTGITFFPGFIKHGEKWFSGDGKEVVFPKFIPTVSLLR